MLRKLFLAITAFLTLLPAGAQEITRLTTEYMDRPMGIDVKQPVFGWQMQSDRYGAAQTAYRIVTATSKENLENGTYTYDSGTVNSPTSVCIKYNGPELAPCTRYYWQVLVTDERGKVHESPASWFETGLMGGLWGNAMWIASNKMQLSPYRFDYAIEYDVETAKPGPAKFIFGAPQEDCYVFVMLDTRDSAKVMLGNALYNKETVQHTLNVSNIIPKADATKKHHIRIEVRGGGNYDMKVSLNGRALSQGNYMPVNCMRDSIGRPQARLFGIGYRQPQGFDAVFSNIKLLNYKWDNLVLNSDPKTYNAKGDNKAVLWMPGSDVNAPIMRKNVNVAKAVKRARLYATARGAYWFYINGQRVGDGYLNPGWTDFRHRIMYNTYDVTQMLRQGNNALGIELGHGWFCDDFGWAGAMWGDQYGYKPSALAMIKVEYTDGTNETFVTDNTWKVYNGGPLYVNNLYHGVIYDAQREVDGWKEPGFNDAAWEKVAILPPPPASTEIQGYVGLEIKNNITLTAKKMTRIGNRFIYDMGQNFAGVPRLKNMKGRKGQTITIHFAEMLYPETVPENPRAPLTREHYERNKGQMYMDNYRSAISTDYYTFRGAPEGETFEPPFTQHGYRYVSIDGLDEPLPLEDVEGIVLESVGEQISRYETSNADINQLFSNIVWGQRGNFLAVPTDCPQRDERLGWTGDANVFCRTSTYNMMTGPFFNRWFYTLRDQKSENGDVGGYYPSLGGTKEGAPRSGFERGCGWSDVTITVPWEMYQQYGDLGFVERHYGAMKDYMKFLESQAKDYIYPDAFYWGDWLAPMPTNISMLSTAYFGYDARLMREMAKALGKTDDAVYYDKLYRNISRAFCNYFFDSEGYTIEGNHEGTPRMDTQTSYLLPLAFLELPEDLQQKAVKHLLEAIERSNYHLQTGFLGTPLLCNVLSNFGHNDIAYRLYTQTEYPSWLFPVKQGATTMWERWNSYTIKEGFGEVSMNSFNHYAYGAIEEWIMSHNLGIQRDENRPGYKHILMQPKIDDTFSFVKGGFRSVYGDISSAWETKPSGTEIEFTIPANTTATFTLPVSSMDNLKLKKGKKGVSSKSFDDGKAVYELKSGTYKFILK
jgi:alpha-L-rhamnosidase